MKKINAIILCAVLLFSMAACSTVTKEPPAAYVPSADIEVAVAFVENSTAKVATRRISDKALISIALACVYYDAQGVQIGQMEIMQCDFTTEGQLHIWSFPAADASQYMDATVSSVTYADGTQKDCPGISLWVEETTKNFSVDNYSKKMAEMANKEAVEAENCAVAEISLGLPGDGKLELNVKNTGGKEIAEVVVYLLWFDAKGVPMDIKGALVPNSEKVSAKTLAIDEKVSYTATAPEGTVYVKGVVQSVTFADGTAWTNSFVYEWAACNYKSL